MRRRCNSTAEWIYIIPSLSYIFFSTPPLRKRWSTQLPRRRAIHHPCRWSVRWSGCGCETIGVYATIHFGGRGKVELLYAAPLVELMAVNHGRNVPLALVLRVSCLYHPCTFCCCMTPDRYIPPPLPFFLLPISFLLLHLRHPSPSPLPLSPRVCMCLPTGRYCRAHGTLVALIRSWVLPSAPVGSEEEPTPLSRLLVGSFGFMRGRRRKSLFRERTGRRFGPP